MTVSKRYIIQIHANGEWKTYLRTRRSKGYTLTLEEAVAYLSTLDQGMQYRVVESVCTDGLINQKVVHNHTPLKVAKIPAEDAPSGVEKVFQAIADGGNSTTVLDMIPGANNLSAAHKAFYGAIEQG